MERDSHPRLELLEKYKYTDSIVRKILGEKKDLSQTDEIHFHSITNSSQEVEKNSLFIPLIGERDGHIFIPDALERGASGFLCHTNHPILDQLESDDRKKAILVPDTWAALKELALHHRLRFSPFIIAITGSSGKTTTKEFMRYAFSHIGEESLVVTEKNFNNEIGLPFTLFRINDRTKFVILEMGMNHRGEIERLTKTAIPNLSMITNIGSAHIENLHSPEEIAREKLDITKGMKPGGELFLPEDISYPDIVKESTDKNDINIHFWNLPNENLSTESKLKIIKISEKGYELTWKNIPFTWNHPGIKILSNLSGVLHIADHLKVEPNQLIANIQKYQPTGSRLKIIKSKYTIIDDTYNANPESMISSLFVAKQISAGKGFSAILGDMKELGEYSEYYHRLVGLKAIESGAQYLVGYGKDAESIVANFQEETNASYKENSIFIKKEPNSEFLAIQKISEWIQSKIPEGSVILIKGSRSMKMESILEKILEESS